MRNRNKGEGLVASFGIGFVVLWVIGFLVSLGLTGVLIWAVISLVNHFTGN